MERGFWIVITIVLSMPIWLLMYDELVPDIINETNTIYVEPDLDCAECIEVCHGTTYEGVIESAYNTTEIIIPVIQEMDTHKQMQEEHPELWDNMKKYFVEEDDTPFKEAFKSARATLGSDEVFEWNGKYYTTNYVEENETLAKKE